MSLSWQALTASLIILPLILARRVLKALLMGRTAVPPEVWFPAVPGELKVRKTVGAGEESYERMNIKTFLEARVPSLFAGFKPTWWLPNGHVQTIYMTLADFTNVDQVVYERTLLRTPDGGSLGLDVTPPSSSDYAHTLSDDTPIIVVKHGLTGGSYEPYVRSILASACKPKSEGGLGYRAVVINFRGCAGTKITSPQFYSAGHTDDLRTGLLFISERWPRAPLVGIGFSLGANVLTRYLGEEGAQSRLRGGIVLACPWDTKLNANRLQDHWFSREVYGRALGKNVMNLFKRHLDEVNALPKGNRLEPQVPIILGLKNPTLMEMDEAMIRVVGGNSPPFPFPTAQDYFQWAQSHPALRTIRVPFLALNTKDDPIVAYNPTHEVAHSSTCALAITHAGGHLGWFHGSSNPIASLRSQKPADRWVREPVLEFLRAVAEDYVPDEKVGPRPREEGVIVDKTSGFVMEVGNDMVGYKIIEEGEIISGAEFANAMKATSGGAGL
ncbi:AB-hydrolase YheT [Clavulina sp. PMI_390]|nr:AB-hydrolase YheT [Clavulina sp. PMI_390]